MCPKTLRKSTTRIKSSQEIQAIRRSGQSVSDERMALVFLPNGLAYSRAAVLASKAVGGAVQRNRCKRILRARLAQSWAEIKPGFDILVVARKHLLESTPSEVDQSFQKLLVWAGINNKQTDDGTNYTGSGS
ncbi:MAG TPA: ribonuclease P protein component [Anaerolineaceae bacterium]|nr:ribonuclease P protein component [Anaerolineaceae bacterium]HUM49314.1 ribonuclease P protein component [Anaerolineaceae bacterium]